MKTKMQTKKKSWIDQFHHVRYFSANENKLNQLMANHNGIHCEGDKFEYIVDWQVGEKKPKDTLH
ncbi:hypothetical protein [Mangrovibacterium diazotrophicum]|uniref:Uncharacterized protein n=1 Tax=Mangrovibacterium diazotrophicum TaxID=1261403 RepID=A0A419W6C6_9BACT|nr:hypothetical protein [Mangrovibacterium diazotrophicum]RKD91005.1 hypothetical protein BC643_1354 [Mangrovibacterium diazotrophicum]